jgi:hypothetical protein
VPREIDVPAGTSGQDALDPRTCAFYCHALITLSESRVPFLVGGGYALERYAGSTGHKKDLDLVVRRADWPRAFEALAAVGYHTELTFPHWLGKVFCGEDYIDLIFSSGNGICVVDDRWFEHGVQAKVLGLPARLCPPEELIWTHAFIMERERYDGADIAHLLRACGPRLDWSRLLERFDRHWRVLLSHLVLFGFIYPSERSVIPDRIMQELSGRLQSELSGPPPADRLCRGTLISRGQYLVDVERWGYQDARLAPSGNMTREQIAQWTAAIGGGT